MLEPAPRNILLPEKEPVIRVGIILPEDKLTEITVNGQLIRTEDLPLKFEQNDQLLPASGFVVEPVIAGRNFHWKKKISATYPGTLEISTEDGYIKLINQLPFEQYLACVVTSEMSAECPEEFMKAQIIAARSWAAVFLHDKHEGRDFDVCNDDDCQRYQGSTFLNARAIDACKATAGQFLQCSQSKYILPAYYIKTCGGRTEETKAIFGFDYDCLVSVPDPYCEQADSLHIEKYLGKVDAGGSHFRWERQVKPTQKIKALDIIKKSVSGRITELEIIYDEANRTVLNSQYQIRETLDPSFLPSSAFTHKIDKDGNISFEGSGWGHGVGLCQVGAVVMALKGFKAEQILKHYFPKANLVKAY